MKFARLFPRAVVLPARFASAASASSSPAETSDATDALRCPGCAGFTDSGSVRASASERDGRAEITGSVRASEARGTLSGTPALAYEAACVFDCAGKSRATECE